MSIYSILKNLKISRKRVRSKYYPEKIEGEEQFDLDEFYSKLKKYKYDKTICIDETVNKKSLDFLLYHYLKKAMPF
jgi:hypothetical protein